MANKKDSAVLLKKISNSLKSSSKIDKEDLIAFVNSNPSKWLSLLLLDGGIPDPTKDKASLAVESLLNVIKEITENDIDNMRLSIDNKIDLLGVVSSLLKLSIFCKEVERRLKTQTNSFSSVSKMTFRLGAWLESQVYVAETRFKQQISGQDIIDPTEQVRADIGSAESGSTKQSIGGILEEQVECAELIIRYMFHVYLPSQGYGSYADSPIPYDDSEVREIISLSNIRRLIDDTWARIKYLSWSHTAFNGGVLYVPPDQEEYELSEIGKVRTNLIRQQDGVKIMQLGGLYNDQERAALDSLKGTVTIPAACALWDGKVDVKGLRALSQSSTYKILNSQSIQSRFYHSILSTIRIGVQNGKEIKWEQWNRAKGFLTALAQVLKEAMESQVSEPGGSGCMQTVICVRKARLVDLMSETVNYDTSEALSIINLFILNHEKRKLEIWDQPLLPLNDDDVLLVPSLIMSGEPTRHLENFIDEWVGSYNPRGPELEIFLETKLRENQGFLVDRNIKFNTIEGSEVEFDLFCYWQNTIILIEAKCLKSIHSAADEHRARAEIEYAIEQLVRRRKIVLSDWTTIKRLVKSWPLPAAPPTEENIICIAVSNITSFTGRLSEGCYVSDTSSLLRFFGDMKVERQVLDKKGLSFSATK